MAIAATPFGEKSFKVDTMQPDRGANSRLKVFISYSRKDEAFVQEFACGLEAAGFEPLLDKDDIAAGEEWEIRLGWLIGTADTVVFVISPDSLFSKRCGWEIERTQQLKKRLLPIVWRGVEEAQVPPRLKQLNYIFFDRPHSFGPSLLTLATALKTDLKWVREHTRIGEAALRWDERGRADALLLRGEELAAATDWLRGQPKYAQEPTLLMHQFIKAGEDAEAARMTAERQRLDQMAAAQDEREKALEREKAALRHAEAAARNRQRMRRAVALLLVSIIAGLIGWINQTYLRERINWFTVMRPYMNEHVRPYVLKQADEGALKSHASFRECDEVCPQMIVIPAGSFTMGSPGTEMGRRSNEGPQQRISIAEPFAVSKFLVTFTEWDLCVSVGGCPNLTDSGFGRGAKPVLNINWDEAKQYVAWLAQMTGQPYRLPSEAEWEYAARAGTTTAYPWGDEIGVGNANCKGCGSRWDNRETSPVGSFNPNAFGLFDMHGNLWQWVEDCYEESLNGVPPDGSARTSGNCQRRVIRGGSWFYGPDFLRSSNRLGDDPGGRGFYVVGFRVARTLRYR
jgi:formylglycine-generating enzyme required for sulfatase activity